MSEKNPLDDAAGAAKDSASDAIGKVRKSAERKNSAVRRVAQAADTGDKRDLSMASRLGFPAIVGIVTLLGLLLVIYAWANRDPEQKPVQGKDHWHAVYGVYDCSLNGGTGGYVPAFQSEVDEEGIHSHKDGIIHIHPWFDSSDGPDARLEVFMTSMQAAITDDSIVLDNGQVLTEGTECNGEPATVHVRKWQFNFEATGGKDPEIFTEDLSQLQFENDREVFILALAPLDADIPIPPTERFGQLEQVSPQIQSTGPVAEDTQTFNVPAPAVGDADVVVDAEEDGG